MNAILKDVISGSLRTIDVREKAMLVTLHLKCYRARKHDKKVSGKVARDNHANQNAGRYNKMLIDTERYIKPIESLQSEMRSHHYLHTSPWMDNGQRILAIANHQAYCEKMNELADKFTVMVDDFLAVYPQAKNEARQFLGDLYDENDYPDVQLIRTKFDAEFFLSPLPDIQDFRVDLPKGDIDRASDKINDALQNAMRDGWARLKECVEAIAVKLPAYDNGEIRQFSDTLIGNLNELLTVLPGLNLFDDPDLNKLAAEARARLAQHPAQALRDSEVLRKDTAKAAQDILNMMNINMLVR